MIYSNHPAVNLLLSVAVKEFVKIDQYLLQSMTKTSRLIFWITVCASIIANSVDSQTRRKEAIISQH